jgi:hypothetical protein
MAVIWALDCFTMWIAWLARTQYQYTEEQFNEDMSGYEGREREEIIFNGRYLETGSSVVILVMLSFILAFILWLRGRYATSPHAATHIVRFPLRSLLPR